MPRRTEAGTKKLDEKNIRRKKLCRETFTNIIAKIALDHFLCCFYHVHESRIVADTMTDYYGFCNTNHGCATIIFIMKAVEIRIIIYVSTYSHIINRFSHLQYYVAGKSIAYNYISLIMLKNIATFHITNKIYFV